MFNVGPLELMVILMVALIVVGPKRLPEIGRQIGRAFTELRRVQDEVRDTIRFDLDDDGPEPPIHRERSGELSTDGHPMRRLAAADPDDDDMLDEDLEARPDLEDRGVDEPPAPRDRSGDDAG
jgi:Tat protein translocase TatB subunit